MYCWLKRLFFPSKKKKQLIVWLAASTWWTFFIWKMSRSFSMISHGCPFIFHTQGLIHAGDPKSSRLAWAHLSEAITLLSVILPHLFHACFKSRGKKKKKNSWNWRNKEAAISLPYSSADDEVESVWWLEPHSTLAMGSIPNLIKKDPE